MKTLIGILIALAVIFFGWRVYDYWVGVDTEREAREQAKRPPPVVPERLEGLPSQLEPSLQEAQKKAPPDSRPGWTNTSARRWSRTRAWRGSSWIMWSGLRRKTRSRPNASSVK